MYPSVMDRISMAGLSQIRPLQKFQPNLTPGGELAFWTEEQFINTIRTGRTPSGHELDPNLMAWKNYRQFYDDELKAIYLYLQSVPKLEQYSE